MSNGAVITFAPLVFERDHFFIFALLDHFGRNFCAGNQWIAMRQIFSVGIHQYIAERRRLASIDIEKIDIDRVALRDPILPPTRLDNCVSHKHFRGEKAAQTPTEG